MVTRKRCSLCNHTDRDEIERRLEEITPTDVIAMDFNAALLSNLSNVPLKAIQPRL